MKEIVKTLLLEGIDEHAIHRVLNVIAENYEIVDEDKSVGQVQSAAENSFKQRRDEYREAKQKYGSNSETPEYKKASSRFRKAASLKYLPKDSNVSMKKLRGLGEVGKKSLKGRGTGSEKSTHAYRTSLLSDPTNSPMELKKAASKFENTKRMQKEE